jgi:hypothetical protein
MKPINILYDGLIDDVDIVLVPDEIADSIEQVVGEFWRWLEVPENKKRFLKPDEKWGQVLSVDTKEFLWWMNNIKITGEEAMILQQHTSFVTEYPTAEF